MQSRFALEAVLGYLLADLNGRKLRGGKLSQIQLVGYILLGAVCECVGIAVFDKGLRRGTLGNIYV